MKRSIPRIDSPLSVFVLLKTIFRTLFSRSSPEVSRETFTRLIEKKWSCAHAIPASSVRLGLYHILSHLKIGPGAEVLCSPVTIHPVLDIIRLKGARIVFFDIHPDDYSPIIESLETKVTPNTRAMLTTHLWGIPNRMDELLPFCEQHNIPLLEDASQCLNGNFQGRHVGTMGYAGLFSLSLTKNITGARAGLVTTENPELAKSLEDFNQSLPGPSRAYVLKWLFAELILYFATRRMLHHLVTGHFFAFLRRNGREDRLNVQDMAAPTQTLEFPEALKFSPSGHQLQMTLPGFENLEINDAKRRAIATRYREHLSKIKDIKIPAPHLQASPNHWVYTIQVADPGKLQDYLWKKHRVDSARPSISACHEMPYFETAQTDLKSASAIWRKALFIPMYPALTDIQVTRIIEAIQNYFAQLQGAHKG